MRGSTPEAYNWLDLETAKTISQALHTALQNTAFQNMARQKTSVIPDISLLGVELTSASLKKATNDDETNKQNAITILTLIHKILTVVNQDISDQGKLANFVAEFKKCPAVAALLEAPQNDNATMTASDNIQHIITHLNVQLTESNNQLCSTHITLLKKAIKEEYLKKITDSGFDGKFRAYRILDELQQLQDKIEKTPNSATAQKQFFTLLLAGAFKVTTTGKPTRLANIILQFVWEMVMQQEGDCNIEEVKKYLNENALTKDINESTWKEKQSALERNKNNDHDTIVALIQANNDANFDNIVQKLLSVTTLDGESRSSQNENIRYLAAIHQELLKIQKVTPKPWPKLLELILLVSKIDVTNSASQNKDPLISRHMQHVFACLGFSGETAYETLGNSEWKAQGFSISHLSERHLKSMLVTPVTTNLENMKAVVRAAITAFKSERNYLLNHAQDKVRTDNLLAALNSGDDQQFLLSLYAVLSYRPNTSTQNHDPLAAIIYETSSTQRASIGTPTIIATLMQNPAYQSFSLLEQAAIKRSDEMSIILTLEACNAMREKIITAIEAYLAADVGGNDGKQRARNLSFHLVDQTDPNFSIKQTIGWLNAFMFHHSSSTFLRATILDYIYPITEQDLRAMEDQQPELFNTILEKHWGDLETETHEDSPPSKTLTTEELKAALLRAVKGYLRDLKPDHKEGRRRAEVLYEMVKAIDPGTPDANKKLYLAIKGVFNSYGLINKALEGTVLELEQNLKTRILIHTSTTAHNMQTELLKHSSPAPWSGSGIDVAAFINNLTLALDAYQNNNHGDTDGKHRAAKLRIKLNEYANPENTKTSETLTEIYKYTCAIVLQPNAISTQLKDNILQATGLMESQFKGHAAILFQNSQNDIGDIREKLIHPKENNSRQQNSDMEKNNLERNFNKLKSILLMVASRYEKKHENEQNPAIAQQLAIFITEVNKVKFVNADSLRELVRLRYLLQHRETGIDKDIDAAINAEFGYYNISYSFLDAVESYYAKVQHHTPQDAKKMFTGDASQTLSETSSENETFSEWAALKQELMLNIKRLCQTLPATQLNHIQRTQLVRLLNALAATEISDPMLYCEKQKFIALVYVLTTKEPSSITHKGETYTLPATPIRTHMRELLLQSQKPAISAIIQQLPGYISEYSITNDATVRHALKQMHTTRYCLGQFHTDIIIVIFENYLAKTDVSSSDRVKVQTLLAQMRSCLPSNDHGATQNFLAYAFILIAGHFVPDLKKNMGNYLPHDQEEIEEFLQQLGKQHDGTRSKQTKSNIDDAVHLFESNASEADRIKTILFPFIFTLNPTTPNPTTHNPGVRRTVSESNSDTLSQPMLELISAEEPQPQERVATPVSQNPHGTFAHAVAPKKLIINGVPQDWTQKLYDGMKTAIALWKAEYQKSAIHFTAEGKRRVDILEDVLNKLTPADQKEIAMLACAIVLHSSSKELASRILVFSGLHPLRLEIIEAELKITTACGLLEKRLRDERFVPVKPVAATPVVSSLLHQEMATVSSSSLVDMPIPDEQPVKILPLFDHPIIRDGDKFWNEKRSVILVKIGELLRTLQPDSKVRPMLGKLKVILESTSNTATDIAQVLIAFSTIDGAERLTKRVILEPTGLTKGDLEYLQTLHFNTAWIAQQAKELQIADAPRILKEGEKAQQPASPAPAPAPKQ